MKMREWILDGTATHEDASKPIKLHTLPRESRVIAYHKLCATIPERYRFCIHLRKGKIVEV